MVLCGMCGVIAQVCNIPNSMTILDDLLPIAVTMSERKLTGAYNFTNPDAISHNEILELYKEVGAWTQPSHAVGLTGPCMCRPSSLIWCVVLCCPHDGPIPVH